MKQVEAVIDTGLNNKRQHQVEMLATSSDFSIAVRDETQIEQTVRILHEKFKGDDQSRQSLTSLQESVSGLQLMEAKPSFSSQGGIVVSDQGTDGKNHQLRVSKEINVKMSLVKNEGVSNKKEVAV